MLNIACQISRENNKITVYVEATRKREFPQSQENSLYYSRSYSALNPARFNKFHGLLK